MLVLVILKGTGLSRDLMTEDNKMTSLFSKNGSLRKTTEKLICDFKIRNGQITFQDFLSTLSENRLSASFSKGSLRYSILLFIIL